MLTSHRSRRRAGALLTGLAIAVTAVLVTTTASSAPAHGKPKPTVVLVHGAFADSSSWNGVVARLRDEGYSVVAAANLLRSLTGDATYVRAVLHAVSRPRQRQREGPGLHRRVRPRHW